MLASWALPSPSTGPPQVPYGPPDTQSHKASRHDTLQHIAENALPHKLLQRSLLPLNAIFWVHMARVTTFK